MTRQEFDEEWEAHVNRIEKGLAEANIYVDEFGGTPRNMGTWERNKNISREKFKELLVVHEPDIIERFRSKLWPAC